MPARLHAADDDQARSPPSSSATCAIDLLADARARSRDPGGAPRCPRCVPSRAHPEQVDGEARSNTRCRGRRRRARRPRRGARTRSGPGPRAACPSWAARRPSGARSPPAPPTAGRWRSPRPPPPAASSPRCGCGRRTGRRSARTTRAMATISSVGRVAAGRVLEAGGDAERALVHPLLDRAQHRRRSSAVSGAVHVADRVLAQRALAEQQRLVDGDARLLQPREVGRDDDQSEVTPSSSHSFRRSSTPTPPSGAAEEPQLPGQLGGDALPHAAVRGGVLEDVAVGVGVDVDEARGRRAGRWRRARGGPARPRSCPTAAIASPSRPTSAGNPGAPVPSSTVPPRITRSKAGAAWTRPACSAARPAARCLPS